MAKTHLLTPDAAVGVIQGSLADDATTINVAAGEGAQFAISTDEFIPCTIRRKIWVPGDPVERVHVTARSTDALTVDRGQESTSGLAWAEDGDNPAYLIACLGNAHVQILRAAYEAADGSRLQKAGGLWGAVAAPFSQEEYAGHNAIGASLELVNNNSKHFAKQITFAEDRIVIGVDTYLTWAAGSIGGPAPSFREDNAGEPGATLIFPAFGVNVITLGTGTWVSRWSPASAQSPYGWFFPAGVYWVDVRLADTGGTVLPNIAYDAGGTDWAGVVLVETTRNYSIRVRTLY